MTKTIKTDVESIEVKKALKWYAEKKGLKTMACLIETALKEYVYRHKRAGMPAVLREWSGDEITEVTDFDIDVIVNKVIERMKK